MHVPPAESLSEFETSLARLLAAAAPQNRTNVLSVPDLKRSFAEDRRGMATDERAHGAATAGTYWNLVMADWSTQEPALFAIAAWRPDVLSVYAGSGQEWTIIGVCDRFTMAEVDEALWAMDAESGVSAREVRLPRGLAEYWVAE